MREVRPRYPGDHGGQRDEAGYTTPTGKERISTSNGEARFDEGEYEDGSAPIPSPSCNWNEQVELSTGLFTRQY